MNDWIYLKNKMPPLREQILFVVEWGHGPTLCLGWYEGNGAWKADGGRTGIFETTTNPVYAWRPRPKLPPVIRQEADL